MTVSTDQLDEDCIVETLTLKYSVVAEENILQKLKNGEMILDFEELGNSASEEWIEFEVHGLKAFVPGNWELDENDDNYLRYVNPDNGVLYSVDYMEDYADPEEGANAAYDQYKEIKKFESGTEPFEIEAGEYDRAYAYDLSYSNDQFISGACVLIDDSCFNLVYQGDKDEVDEDDFYELINKVDVDGYKQ